MPEGPWFIMLTDPDGDALIVNLSAVTYAGAHMEGGAFLVLRTRDTIIVQETPQEIADRILRTSES